MPQMIEALNRVHAEQAWGRLYTSCFI